MVSDNALVSKFRKECKVAPIVQKPSSNKPVIENIDKNYNCFLLSEYAEDIYKYLREVEVSPFLHFLVMHSTYFFFFTGETIA